MVIQRNSHHDVNGFIIAGAADPGRIALQCGADAYKRAPFNTSMTNLA